MSIEKAKNKINKYITVCIESNDCPEACLSYSGPERWLKEILKELNNDDTYKSLLNLKDLCLNNLNDAINSCDKINAANYVHHIAHIKQTLMGLKFLAQEINNKYDK